MKLFSVLGNSQRLDGGAMFGHAPKELWKQWMPPDELNRISLSTRALLVQTTDGRNFLFEAGVGAFFEPKLQERYGIVEKDHVLLKSLKDLGLSDSDIDGVILSHLHFDHAGGLLSQYGDGPQRLLFPKANYYVGKAHWERAKNPHFREKASFIAILPELLEKSGRLRLVESERHPDLDFGVSFIFSNGHTIGLMLAHLQTYKGPLVFASDLMPGLPWMNLPIAMGYDRFPELLVDEKRIVLESLASVKGKLFFTHDPNQACVEVIRSGDNKFVGTPLSLESLS